MLAIQGMYEAGKIQLLDPLPFPVDVRSRVAVVFLDKVEDQEQEARETIMLAYSPTFRRLAEHGLGEIEQGKTRPVKELLDELPMLPDVHLSQTPEGRRIAPGNRGAVGGT